MWVDWMGNIDPVKWVKAYFVKRNTLYDTLLSHLMEIYPVLNEEELRRVALQLEQEVREVMGWTS